MTEKTEEREVHSEIGASSAGRWMNCPGSVRLLRTVPKKGDTEYTIQGTAAHQLCEDCLTTGQDPREHIGWDIEVRGGAKVHVTEEMAEACAVYCDIIRADHKEHGGTLLVEREFDLSWLHQGLFGRNDACIIPADWGGVLRVYDYKNGVTPVAAVGNQQLMYYALGAIGGNGNLWPEKVVCTIVQPNCPFASEAVKRWEISGADLRKWAEEVLVPAAKATEAEDAPCVTGDWCRFCDACGTCRVKAEEAVALFQEIPVDKVQLDRTVRLPSVDTLTPEQLGRVSSFFTSKRFQDWVKAVAQAELETLQSGAVIPGRVLVTKEKKGLRKWADIDAVKKELGPVFGADLYDNSLKSPAQIEKMYASRKVKKEEYKATVDGLVTRDVTIQQVVEDGTPDASCPFAPAN